MFADLQGSKSAFRMPQYGGSRSLIFGSFNGLHGLNIHENLPEQKPVLAHCADAVLWLKFFHHPFHQGNDVRVPPGKAAKVAVSLFSPRSMYTKIRYHGMVGHQRNPCFIMACLEHEKKTFGDKASAQKHLKSQKATAQEASFPDSWSVGLRMGLSYASEFLFR